MNLAPCVLGLKAQQRRRGLITGKKGILGVCMCVCMYGWVGVGGPKSGNTMMSWTHCPLPVEGQDGGGKVQEVVEEPVLEEEFLSTVVHHEYCALVTMMIGTLRRCCLPPTEHARTMTTGSSTLMALSVPTVGFMHIYT